MSPCLLHGALTRLVAVNTAADVDTFVRWWRDSEYLRLFNSGPAQAWSLPRARTELNHPPAEHLFEFMIRDVVDDRALGFLDLDVDGWAHGNGWVGIAIGDRADWGRGYGTDAMRVLLRFAFQELNLHRVSLTVFGYNPRAIRSYEKAGFVVEGRVRQRLHRAGQRWDVMFMGILHQEWLSSNR